MALTGPYIWLAIGDPDTIVPALQVPGGALAAVRSVAATTDVEPLDHLIIDALREVSVPQYATPAPSPTPTGD